MNKDNYLIPKLRKQSTIVFAFGLGLAIAGELLRFITELTREKNDSIVVGATLSAVSEVIACTLLLIALFSINEEIAGKFKDVINLRSLAILSFSYCAYVVTIILEDYSQLGDE